MDSLKSRPELIPAEALLEVGRVFGFGAAKYRDNNEPLFTDLDYKGTASDNVGAALRHIFKYLSEEPNDEESNLHHLAHAISRLCIAYYLDYYLCVED